MGVTLGMKIFSHPEKSGRTWPAGKACCIPHDSSGRTNSDYHFTLLQGHPDCILHTD
jgi:hypothetical protein